MPQPGGLRYESDFEYSALIHSFRLRGSCLARTADRGRERAAREAVFFTRLLVAGNVRSD